MATRKQKSNLLQQRTSINLSDLVPIGERHRNAIVNSHFSRNHLEQLRSLEQEAGSFPHTIDNHWRPAASLAISHFEQSMSQFLPCSGERPLIRPENLGPEKHASAKRETYVRQRLMVARDASSPAAHRIRFHNICTANNIRERSTETARLAGGLLGPYRVNDCKSLQLFKRKHLRLLEERSLRPEEVDQNALVFCLSYRHKTGKREFEKDRMSQLEYLNWLRITSLICSRGETVYFWQDQKAKGVRTDTDLDWIANGIVPYLMCPVLALVSSHGEVSDMQRLWISVERCLAMMSSGYILVGRGPPENRVKYSLLDIDMSERKFAAMVLHGLFEGKETYHEDDRLKMIRWAVAQLVTLSPQSSLTITDIRREATIQAAELEELCTELLLYPMSEGLTVAISRRQGRSHTNWADLLPIFETQNGNIPGAISVWGEHSHALFEGDYNIMRSQRWENVLYYVRFECRDYNGIILTGKVRMEKIDDFSRGAVLEGRKVFSSEFSCALHRFAAKLVYLIQTADDLAFAKAFVTDRKQIIKETTRRVVAEVWELVGGPVHLLPGSEVAWK